VEFRISDFEFVAHTQALLSVSPRQNCCRKACTTKKLARSHPETPVETAQFPMRKRAIFVQGPGDQGFARRRTRVRRTRKSEDRRRDCRKAPFSDGN
jgi:hypothetical protein